MNGFDDNVSDDDKEKLAGFLNQQPQQDADRQARMNALNKMITTPNPEIENVAMGSIGAPAKVEGELLGAAQEYTPEALAAAKQGVNDAMQAAKGAYWDPAVKQAQSKFNNLSDLISRRTGK